MMAGLENDLFSLLWSEIDFDDHPISGGHVMEPEGEVEISVYDDCIAINDNRIEMILVRPDIIINNGTEGLKPEVVAASKAIVTGAEEPPPRHIIVLTDKPEVISNPPENVHSSTLPRSWISQKLAKSEYFEDLLSEPLISLGNPAPWRDDLWSWRQQLSPLFPGWTWHLEFGNKSDRLGWYIRAPGNTLFTVFLGWGGLDNGGFEGTGDEIIGIDKGLPGGDATGKHGFFLFERAPLDQLDRPDEAEPNRADHLRTQHLFSKTGILTNIANAASRGDVDLEFAEIISPVGGSGCELWPLVIGRCPSEFGVDEVGEWFCTLLRLLRPAIDYVSMT
jgi:hypothetical protein